MQSRPALHLHRSRNNSPTASSHADVATPCVYLQFSANRSHLQHAINNHYCDIMTTGLIAIMALSCLHQRGRRKISSAKGPLAM